MADPGGIPLKITLSFIPAQENFCIRVYFFPFQRDQTRKKRHFHPDNSRQCQVINNENLKIVVMIGGICPTCGLPKELCICEEVAKEQQRINVKVNKRRYGKEVTVIEGLDPTDIDLDVLSKFMKGKLACGGTVKGNSIELQGNHRDRVKELLSSKGYSTENIS